MATGAAHTSVDKYSAGASKGDKLEQNYLLANITDEKKKEEKEAIPLTAEALKTHKEYIKEKNLTTE